MSPQLEDGFTRIANELLEALCRMPLGNSEGQIFLCILRKTYGWGKKQDDISISQIETATGISRRMVIYGVQNLEARKLLKITRKKGRGVKNEINEIAIQKNHDLWVVQGKSTQYKNTLEKQRVAYAKGKDLVVQGIEEKGQILAPTKERKKQKKEPIARKEPSGPHHIFIAWWQMAFLKVTGHKPTINGKTGSQVQAMLKDVTKIQTLITYASIMLTSEDTFYEKAGKTLGVLQSQLDGFKSKKNHYDMALWREIGIIPPEGTMFDDWKFWEVADDTEKTV